MAICSKCGNEIPDGSLVCDLCGAPAAEPAETKTSSAPDLSLEESIELAEKLQKNYAQMESIDRQIADNKKEIEQPIKINIRRRTMFRFFWPFLVMAIISFGVIEFIAMLFLVNREHSKYTLLVLAIAVLFALFLIIIGIILSKKKVREENDAYFLAEEMAKDKKQKLREKNRELESTYDSLVQATAPYNKIVPQAFRKSSSMARIKLMLQSGKATDFNDALSKSK